MSMIENYTYNKIILVLVYQKFYMLFLGPHIGWPNTSNIVCVSDGDYPPHPLEKGTQNNWK